MPGSRAPKAPENIKNLPREEQERLALEAVINERVESAVVKNPKLDKEKLRESMLGQFQKASSVPKMEGQIHQSYKEQYESRLKDMLNKLRMLRLKVPKSKEERDQVNKEEASLRKEIELQRKAIAEWGK